MFGQEKFALRMTLSDALCDDLVAIEACLCRLLPHLDTSGRQLLLLEPCRHTREGYTSESMVRSVDVVSHRSKYVHDCTFAYLFVIIHLTQLHSSCCSCALFGMCSR